MDVECFVSQDTENNVIVLCDTVVYLAIRLFLCYHKIIIVNKGV